MNKEELMAGVEKVISSLEIKAKTGDVESLNNLQYIKALKDLAAYNEQCLNGYRRYTISCITKGYDLNYVEAITLDNQRLKSENSDLKDKMAQITSAVQTCVSLLPNEINSEIKKKIIFN